MTLAGLGLRQVNEVGAAFSLQDVEHLEGSLRDNLLMAIRPLSNVITSVFKLLFFNLT
jgi:hypothetical protein